MRQSKERRQHVRIKKNYIIRFNDKSNPALKYEMSQIENISKGGLCFTSSLHFDEGANVSIELRTPYIADTIFLEGMVLESRERVRGLIYENRMRFTNLTPETSEILDKIERYNTLQR